MEKDVDIINISWSIEKTEFNKDDICELERALDAAAKKDIILVCAASDQGAYKDRTYPAAYSKKILKIGAAEASGTALKWLGDQTAVDFILPGHQVVVDRHGDAKSAKYTTLTGSSIATALASGLAAVILYCVQIGCVLKSDRRPTDSDFHAYRALKNHESMRDALSRIGTSKESENKFITVWERFAKPVKKAENEPRDRWIDLVQQLAVHLKGDD